MKLIELHILQSFPVSCLNRDDVGAPKSAVFGGVNRARLSSQALKRAIREYAQDFLPAARFGGKRSRLIIEPLTERLARKLGDKAALYATQAADLLSGRDDKSVSEDGQPKDGKRPRVSTLIFLSSAELDALADAIAEVAAQEKKGKLDIKKLTKACQGAPLSDAADIAIFGRMVAKGPDLTLEGAAMFGHALSTHKADNEIDFFSAVDDEKLKEEDAGAGMIGTIEFTSAVYYRYAALNLTMLADEKHLKNALNHDERRAVVDAFLRATILAVPSARKNSMNAHTPPAYVLGIARDQGQPMQLVNAFERPVFARGGLATPSARELLLHRAELNRIFGLPEAEAVATGFLQPKADAEADREERKLLTDAIPAHLSLDEFCKRLTAHVL